MDLSAGSMLIVFGLMGSFASTMLKQDAVDSVSDRILSTTSAPRYAMGDSYKKVKR